MIASDAIMIADPRQGSYGGESFGGAFGLRIPVRSGAIPGASRLLLCLILLLCLMLLPGDVDDLVDELAVMVGDGLPLGLEAGRQHSVGLREPLGDDLELANRFRP